MYDTLLFDCDGVLVDSEKGLAVISAQTLREKYGFPAKPSDFIEFIGKGEEGYIGGVVNKYGGIYSDEMKEDIYREYISKAGEVVETFDGTLEILKKFRDEGYKIAVASSSDLVKVSANLKVVGIGPEFFDAVITGSDVLNKKPDPEIYIKAMNACSSEPDSCVIIEDAVSGIMAGKNAGIDVIAYTSSLSKDELLAAGAFECISGPYELYEVICEKNKKAHT